LTARRLVVILTVVAGTTVSDATTLPGAPTGADVPTRLLVLGMVRADGSVHAAELQPIAEACGQTAEQVRSCLRRLVAEGLFTRHGSGRDARFHATAAGFAALGSTMERTRLAYAQDSAGKGWDRRWHLVAFAIPERDRAARDALRARLLALGGAGVQSGLYVSPHRWHADVVTEARRLAVDAHLTLATTDDLEVSGAADPREIARRLWPLDELAARYQRFLEHYGALPDLLAQMRREKRRLADAEFLPGALAMGVEFQECFRADPLLPPELLPRPWPGRAARELVARSRRLGVLLREAHDRPALFAPFDDLLDTLP
jgi:phenylacetic acid degradation operon negative regulatory protein